MSPTRNTRRSVSLSPAQLDYLSGATFLPPHLQRIVRAAEAASGAARLNLDVDVAEEFRSAFTIRLAEAGFDSDYEPTREGALLEDLIDAFFREAE